MHGKWWRAGVASDEGLGVENDEGLGVSSEEGKAGMADWGLVYWGTEPRYG